MSEMEANWLSFLIIKGGRSEEGRILYFLRNIISPLKPLTIVINLKFKCKVRYKFIRF